MSTLPAAIAAVAETTGENTGEAVVFWITAVLAVVGALGLVFSHRTVHSALFTALTMMNLAVLYAADGAPFLALVQVIVYTGAVMMLFLFVVMLVGVDASDSLVETIKGQRIAAVLLVLGFGTLLVLTVGTALEGVTATGVQQVNDAHGGNVEGLAHLMFTTYLLPLEVIASLLVVAALGALVLTHRDRWEPKKTQPMLAAERMRDYADTGAHPGNLPNPGVLATSNAIGTPALLPDGTPTELSVPLPLRGREHPHLAEQPGQIAADEREVRQLAAGEQAEPGAALANVDGHFDPSEREGE